VKTIIYTGGAGPDTITAGAAGTFTKGKPRDIEDDVLADQLLAKGCFISDPPTDRVALVAAQLAATVAADAEASVGEHAAPAEEPASSGKTTKGKSSPKEEV
jgi:hypothetical protein